MEAGELWEAEGIEVEGVTASIFGYLSDVDRPAGSACGGIEKGVEEAFREGTLSGIGEIEDEQSRSRLVHGDQANLGVGGYETFQNRKAYRIVCGADQSGALQRGAGVSRADNGARVGYGESFVDPMRLEGHKDRPGVAG